MFTKLLSRLSGVLLVSAALAGCAAPGTRSGGPPSCAPDEPPGPLIFLGGLSGIMEGPKPQEEKRRAPTEADLTPGTAPAPSPTKPQRGTSSPAPALGEVLLSHGSLARGEG
ncbi:hypothetical protein HY251_06060 [bacterium]|nr:hypothetical protein [bacterium]